MATGDEEKPKKVHKIQKAKALPKKILEYEFFQTINQFIGGLVIERLDLDQKKKEETFIETMLMHIKKLFPVTKKEQEKEDKKLAGRIRELNKNASDVLRVLNVVREDLKNEVDTELYSFVESVMTPMIRDVERVQKIIKSEGSVQTKASAFNKYNAWIDKAKLWVQVCSTAKDKNALGEAVVKHTVEDFIAMIDRDLQLIEDYQVHLLVELDITDSEKEALKVEIEETIKPYLKNLVNLKNYPKQLNLENLSKWKDNAERRRDRHFNMMLQMIDNVINELNPNKIQNGDHNTLIDNLEQISYLEMEIPMLAEKFNQNQMDAFEFEVSLHQLLALEQEIHDLYLDMRMPPDVIERLASLKVILEELFLKIKNQ